MTSLACLGGAPAPSVNEQQQQDAIRKSPTTKTIGYCAAISATAAEEERNDYFSCIIIEKISAAPSSGGRDISQLGR